MSKKLDEIQRSINRANKTLNRILTVAIEHQRVELTPDAPTPEQVRAQIEVNKLRRQNRRK